MGFNKKVLSKAVSELGKAKAPAKPRDITVDPKGYWNPANQGKPVRIPGNGDPKGVPITMGSDPKTGQSVPFPVWAQPNVGPGVAMQKGQDYYFPGASYVDETPIAKKGGTLKSKKYSKSMSATNKLFVKNKLFKNKKSKIFDPNAEFKSGGSKLGPINLDPNPLSHYELNYGFNLPTKQDGGDIDAEELELTDEEIQAYRDGGYVVEELPEHEIGGYVQHELVKAQKGLTKKPLEIADPKEFAYRNKMYADSLSLYNTNKEELFYTGLPKIDKTTFNKYEKENKLRYDSNPRKNTKNKFSKITEEGLIKTPIWLDTKGKPEWGKYKTFDPITNTTREYTFGDSLYYISNDNIKPIKSEYFGKNIALGRNATQVKNIYKKPTQQVQFVKEGDQPKNSQIDTLPLKPIERFTPLEQNIIPGKQQIKPFQYKWREWKPAVYEGKNLEMPEGSTQADVEKKIRKLQAEEFQRKTLEYQQQQRGNSPVTQMRKQGGAITESWEDELDDHTIKLLRKAGYTVEELD